MLAKLLTILGKVVLTIVFIAILNIVGVVLIMEISSAITGLHRSQMINQTFISRLILILTTLANIGAVWVMYYFFERRQGLFLGWSQKKRWQSCLEGSLWGIFIMTLSFLCIWYYDGLYIVGFSLGKNVIAGLLFAVLLFALVAIGEEMLCRGYWYGLIERSFGPMTAVIATSILFATLHLTNPNVLQSPIPVINLLLGGLLLGVSRKVTQGLWVPIGVHFTWNLFQGNVFGFAVSGLQIQDSVIRIHTTGHPLISGGGFGAEGSVITGAVLVFFTFSILWWYRAPKSLG